MSCILARWLLYMCFLVPVLLHPAGFRRPILPCPSFSGRRCSAPVPGAAAVARFLPKHMFFFQRLLWHVGSPRNGVASCLRARVSCHHHLPSAASTSQQTILSSASPMLAAVAWRLNQVLKLLLASYSACLLYLVLPLLSGANVLHPSGASDLEVSLTFLS